uniref:Sorting nexin-17-like n=1 Tax=Salarias fasciatus TaxID=181472 RepID=A0A672FH90_SALFA
MHFSIPETEVRSGDNGSTYVAYNIHVNGVLHCRVRYSQLLGLHEQAAVARCPVLPFSYCL